MHRKRRVTSLLLLACLASSGCYYGHVAAGQTRLLLQREPIDRLRDDPSTPAPLRERLTRVDRVRDFAARLGLRIEGQYTTFVDAPGRGIVTSVVASRPGELEPAGFWFPVLGRLPYKGFFDVERAEREAARLRDRGLDVCVSAIPAYSTLGWFDDPLTGPMLRLDDLRLIETVLHELTHATVYAHDAPEFNEGLASFVGQEALVRFVASETGPESSETRRARARVEDDRLIARSLAAFRERVGELYAREPAGPGRDQQREEIEAHTRTQLAELPLSERDPSEVAAGARLNDACQALTRAYDGSLERWSRRLRIHQGDLTALLDDARGAAGSDDPDAAIQHW